jgi:hypothetical protein
MEMMCGSIKRYLNRHAAVKKAAVRWALRYEEGIKDRAPARWICSHGIETFGGGSAPASAAQWERERARIREEFRRSSRSVS